MSREGCTLAEALAEAYAAGLVMQTGGWLFINETAELAVLGEEWVRVMDYGVRRVVLLPSGERLTFVPSDRMA